MTPGSINTPSLLTQCAETLLDHWQGGSRDAYFLMRARHQAESVIEVLRLRGLLNLQGVEICRAEIGPLEVGMIKENMG